MSYLDPSRFHFRGWFQADVSTINNDVRFYQNSSFVPDYQQLNQNGSWNPEGTGVFRILDCNVTNPALGLTLQNAAQRAPGKLVDLDPQQQMVSQIWGMQLRLVDPTGQTLLQGDFKPAAFINLWRRQLTGVPRDQQLAAVYQSVLENVEWFDISPYSFLQTIQQKSEPNQLSINFNVFGYGRDNTIPRYTMGHLVGAIGPYTKNEPKHFTRGRQLVYSSGPNFTQPNGGIGNVQAIVSPSANTLIADFGNSFPIQSADSGLKDIGPVYLGVLTTNPTRIQTTVTADQLVLLGEVPYKSKDWYTTTAGIQAFDLTTNAVARQLLPHRPLVVLSPIPNTTGYNVLLQESINGLYVRADNFVFRLDPSESKPIEFYADQFGAPLANAAINLSPTQGFMGGSGGGDTVSPPTRPAAPIPDIATPAGAINFPSTVTTDASGHAVAKLTASADGPGNPRGYIPGQVYGIAYQLQNQPANYVSNPLNYISILAFNRKDPPETPTWYGDIQQIFTQFGNLYPIMGRYVVNLADYSAVVQRLKVLRLAFKLPIEDPNHMPVTRDLGAGDRATILKWLETKGPGGLPPLGVPTDSPAVAQPASVDSRPAPELLPGQAAGKTAVLLQIQRRAKGESQ